MALQVEWSRGEAQGSIPECGVIPDDPVLPGVGNPDIQLVCSLSQRPRNIHTVGSGPGRSAFDPVHNYLCQVGDLSQVQPEAGILIVTFSIFQSGWKLEYRVVGGRPGIIAKAVARKAGPLHRAVQGDLVADASG